MGVLLRYSFYYKMTLERMVIIEKLEKNKYWIWFSLIKNLGNKKKLKLIKYYKEPEKIYNLKRSDLLKINWLNEENVNNILQNDIRQKVILHMEYMSKNKINIISILDDKYPRMLRNIYDPPLSLYVKGNDSIFNTSSIAIVGCRECTEYGKNAAKYFAYNLAKKDIVIISGLAKGIDSFSHIGALEANKKTIAIIGNGLDYVYPKENHFLSNQIIDKGGAIVSEYCIGTKPNKYNFPARNRIISGMSIGIIVIEAKRKSGTLITVDFALEQGRDVFVVPGNINSENSIGTNELIKQGAIPVIKYNDILENYE